MISIRPASLSAPMRLPFYRAISGVIIVYEVPPRECIKTGAARCISDAQQTLDSAQQEVKLSASAITQFLHTRELLSFRG